MEVSDQLLCLFNAEIEEQNGSYVIEIPEREFSIGELQKEKVYRFGVFTPPSSKQEFESEPKHQSEPSRGRGLPEPPVEEGEFREVEIEDVGDQGDGIARVNRGFVVIVPNADIGDRVTVEITHVKENYAVGEVAEGLEAGV